MTEWKVKLIEKIHRTTNIYSFRFERPDDLKYKAGQFSYFYIPKERGEELFHHFSFSSSPTESFIEFTTRIRDSEYKQTLDKLPIGATIRMSMVLGQFTVNPNFKKVAFVCGGIGITAARSNIKWILDTKLDIDSVLLYANRHQDHISFREELENFSQEKLKVFHIISQPDDSWKGATGRINADFILKNVPDCKERRWFASGPSGLVNEIDKILKKEICIPNEVIREEFFIGYE
jgi:ferredoxin-NADP reductase